MSDNGEKAVASSPAKVSLTASQLESLDSLQAAWKDQELYIHHLESQNKLLEGSLERAKETEDKIKQQYAESQHRERVLVRRLAAKEQEIQEYVIQITELKSAQSGLNGRPTLLDPAVNLLILRLKQELATTRSRLEETQNELSAWKFTPDSNTGKKLMAKCRLLHQENEDLGKMTSSGRIAKLEGDLALQKSFSEEVKKSQSELDDILQELDEDVEGMQSTVLFLQQELRQARERPPSPAGAPRAPSDDQLSKIELKEVEQIHVKQEQITESEGNAVDKVKRDYASDSESEGSATEPEGGVKKRRRASVLSLDYNEEDDPVLAANGDAE